MSSVAPYRKRRSAHTPAAHGSKWIRAATRWAIYLRDNFTCVYCGTIGKLSLDHVHGVANGQHDNDPSNLVTCCISCNSAKKALSRRAWYAVLRERGLLIPSVQRRIARLTLRPIDRARGRFLAGCGHEDDHEAERVESVPAGSP